MLTHGWGMNLAIFPASCRDRFPAAASYRDCVTPEGKRSLPLQSPPHREALGPLDTPARDLLSVVNQGCLWMAAQAVEVQSRYCELAGSEGKKT